MIPYLYASCYSNNTVVSKDQMQLGKIQPRFYQWCITINVSKISEFINVVVFFCLGFQRIGPICPGCEFEVVDGSLML